ncbi:signal peptidase I [Bacillus piscicola]|uniref:signal peptidase I n=1 Tax=Bacillus piscicola TaxID=1632684 RepID=UPI001F09728A|nr:signal peptidase I [Bacillus piscicola]
MYIKGEWWREAAVLFSFAVMIAGITRLLFIAPIIVEGDSMNPTLMDQDRVIMNKSSYWLSEPERFDVIVFHASKERDYIKRIIGLPGDTLYYRDDTLYVNNKAVPEPFLEPLKNEYDPELITQDFTLEQTTGSVVIPQGYVFVLGDNRRHSLDSRIIGLVRKDDIVGEAAFTYWPLLQPRHSEGERE